MTTFHTPCCRTGKPTQVHRTSLRNFEIIAVAEHDDVAFACWRANLMFKAGLKLGPATTLRPFDLNLEGICRFKFSEAGYE